MCVWCFGGGGLLDDGAEGYGYDACCVGLFVYGCMVGLVVFGFLFGFFLDVLFGVLVAAVVVVLVVVWWWCVLVVAVWLMYAYV